MSYGRSTSSPERSQSLAADRRIHQLAKELVRDAPAAEPALPCSATRCTGDRRGVLTSIDLLHGLRICGMAEKQHEVFPRAADDFVRDSSIPPFSSPGLTPISPIMLVDATVSAKCGKDLARGVYLIPASHSGVAALPVGADPHPGVGGHSLYDLDFAVKGVCQ